MSVKILSVDDSRTIRMIVKKAFAAYDCQLFEAENGVEGLALAAKEAPDLIILDITMPVMTGIEMLSKLKEDPQLKDIPVIMLTAESGKDNVMQIVKMGVKDYIVKPFKGEQLIDRATRIIDLKPKAAKPAAAGGKEEATRYLKVEDGIPVLRLPVKVTRNIASQIDSTMKGLLAKDGAVARLIVDLTQVSDFNMSAIQLIISIVNRCRKVKTNLRLVGSDVHRNALKSFQETSSIAIDDSLESARAAF